MAPIRDHGGAKLLAARLVGVKAEGANLRDAGLRGTDLAGGDFSLATLAGSQIDFANLYKANLGRVAARSANFAYSNLTDVNAGAGDMHGANFRDARLGGASFNVADLQHASFRGAYFHKTTFSSATIDHTTVTPSNINSDPGARSYFFQRVDGHIDAYGDYGSCSGSGSGANDAVDCDGANHSPTASFGFGGRVSFGWGSRRVDGRRGFHIYGSNGLKLQGTADMGLAEFGVDAVVGSLGGGAGSATRNDAPRGEAGGPISLHVGYHSGFKPGYHLNFQGWVPRLSQAGG